MARKKQWHPVFAELLRPLMEGHYDVQTNVPVGDAPRAADFVLLRRTRAGKLPAGGLWLGLTPWNVLEYKGPTVSPRDGDLDALVEVGLGIHRRLDEERARKGKSVLPPSDVSFWYLAHHLGGRLLRGWSGRVPGLQPHGPGVWRCDVLGRWVFLVSGSDLPVEEATLPLHLISREPGATEEAVARFVAGDVHLWERYGGWLASLHPAAFREVKDMAKGTKNKLGPDLSAVIEIMGLDWVIQQAGAKQVINHLGLERVVEEAGGVEQLWAALSPEQRQKLKRLAEE